MKPVKLLALALALCTVFAACGAPSSSPEEGKTLNLYTWEGMFPQEVLDGFEESTGISINYVNFDYDETMLTQLQAANGGEYDLIIADDYIIETAIQENLVDKLEPSKIPNYENIDPTYQSQFYDPENLYTVPYGAGVQTIVYRPDSVDVEITGYEDLWDTSLQGKLGVIGNSRVITGMAQKVLGMSYNTSDGAEIQAAGEKLLELAPNIRLIKDDHMEDDLISGEIQAAVMYTSMATNALLADPSLKTVYPKEGVGFGIMAQFIPINAPHKEAAYAFIDYILNAETAAACFEHLGYYSTNKAANEFISPEMKEFLTIPENVDMSDSEMIENVSADALEAHEQAWTTFKAACE